jgi:hypothetical protein
MDAIFMVVPPRTAQSVPSEFLGNTHEHGTLGIPQITIPAPPDDFVTPWLRELNETQSRS